MSKSIDLIIDFYIGLMKSRFRILQAGTLRTRLVTTQKVIRAVASLHNMALEFDDPMPEDGRRTHYSDEGTDSFHECHCYELPCRCHTIEMPLSRRIERARGQAKRDAICQEYFG